MSVLRKSIVVVLITLAIVSVGFYIFYTTQETIEVQSVRNNSDGEYISLSKGKVRYEFFGSPESELVILVHGGGSTGAFVWSKTVPALTNAGFRVLCYDLYGRGYSDSPDVTYNPELLYRQFEELLDSLGIPQQFSIIGQSMGAMVATHFSSRNPERIKKLLYIAPANLGAYSEKWYLKAPILSDLLMTAYWFPRTINNQMNEFYEPTLHQEYEEKLRFFTKIKGYKRVNLSTWLNTLTVNLQDELKTIGEHDTNVLLIMGKSDPLIPVDSRKIYEEAIPSISVRVIEEAGHMPHYEQPEIVNEFIIDFLSQ